MTRILTQHYHHQRDGILAHSPSLSPLSSSSPSEITISPSLLLVIVILALIFFVLGTLHLLYRFFIKRQPFSSISHSNRYSEISGSLSLGRQLRHLFRLHDSGLDQSLIDTLPIFYYKDIMGKKEPFDCAVCLCVFSAQDQLRLIPMCSHAFHTNCIDTWLLSNSTCPLCRGTVNSGLSMKTPLFNFNGSMENSSERCCDEKSGSMLEKKFEKRVLSVRLGKFRSLNEGESGGGENEISSCNLDARRCFSMGSFQYVVGDSDLQVVLFDASRDSAINGDLDGKKIGYRIKSDSFSVSKVWLWSKKGKFPISSSEAKIAVCSHNIGHAND